VSLALINGNAPLNAKIARSTDRNSRHGREPFSAVLFFRMRVEQRDEKKLAETTLNTFALEYFMAF